MGLLEEAIREHLELKRKHGASDDELLQEEADALGPARREELAVGDAEPESDADGAVVEEELGGEELPAEPSEAKIQPPPELPVDAAAPEPSPEEQQEPAMPVEEPQLEPPDAAEESLPEEPLDSPPESAEQGRLGSEQKSARDFDFD
jgi:hypothetical protein